MQSIIIRGDLHTLRIDNLEVFTFEALGITNLKAVYEFYLNKLNPSNVYSDVIKERAMYKAILAKFSFDTPIQEQYCKRLLDTENANLYYRFRNEDKKFDIFWGVDENNKGENVYGKLLVRRRRELQTENEFLKSRINFPIDFVRPHPNMLTIKSNTFEISKKIDKAYHKLSLKEKDELFIKMLIEENDRTQSSI